MLREDDPHVASFIFIYLKIFIAEVLVIREQFQFRCAELVIKLEKCILVVDQFHFISGVF
jgi:hypothetical protein